MFTVTALPTSAADHVQAASGTETWLYLGAVVLWLIGVVAVIVRKLRSA
jgi:hypothetical protein